jgi:hypothetical protein
MCTGVALIRSEFSLDHLREYGLARRVHERGGEQEVRFLYRDHDPRLPVWHGGRLLVVRWGYRRRRSARNLPTTGWTWRSTVEAGGWGPWAPEPVDIPANFGFDRGVWYRVRQGMRGLLVRDDNDEPVVYMICEPATRYYQVMTRSDRMPVLIDEVI